MRQTPFFPMTSKSFIASLCAVSGIAFVLYFFLAPPPPTYSYLRTETGEVTAILPANNRYQPYEASVSVRLDDGAIIYVDVPTRKSVVIGQSIEFDILESDREKLIYRLAQPAVAP